MARAKKVEIASENGQHTLTFANGEVVQTALPQEHALYARFAEYGYLEKIRGVINAADTVENAVKAAKEMIAAFDAGNWNVKRGNGSTVEPASNYLVRALVEITGNTAENVAKFLESQTEQARKDLKADPAVKKVILELRAKDAGQKTGSNLADTLAALMA